MKELFISLASNRSKDVQKQKDILVNKLKQLELRHKHHTVLDLEQKIKVICHQIDFTEANEKLDFVKQKYFETSHLNCYFPNCLRTKELLFYLGWNQVHFHNEGVDEAIDLNFIQDSMENRHLIWKKWESIWIRYYLWNLWINKREVLINP